ncbi:ester cyclase [Nocardioides humilatus]|uniref:Ester cyclase n=1 Tax=Nocardioides humilatus TaxID=2607660 RepID=A0A5B1L6R1_9ACTN|nr:ester cyclase [Nocardioides humilatus]KAA1415858.1 ester cyclase [Nocardioides humilatus]
MTPTPDQRAAREKLVLDHFHDEVAQDWDQTLSTFPHPHYELIPMLLVHDGDTDVRAYYHDTRVAFPDQDHEIIALRHSDDAVIVEFWLMGTHLGPLGKMPATGSRHRTRMTAFFIFDEDDNLVCERVYFDRLSLVTQLLGGINLKDPRNWFTFGRAVAGMLSMSGTAPDPRITETTAPDFPGYAYERHRPR